MITSNQVLRDFNKGDRVNIFVDKNNVTLSSDKRSGEFTLPCTIVGKLFENIIIGWLDGDVIPSSNSSVIYKDKNSYPPCVAWMEASAIRAVAAMPTDGPCRQCSKQNSTQDTKCWWCQVSCPTDLKRKGP